MDALKRRVAVCPRTIVLVVALLVPSWSAAAAVPQALIEQAQFWEQRGENTRALESWQRVLAADANNVLALGRLAVLNATAGDPAAAQRYLERLRGVAPDSPAIAQAQAVLRGDAGAVSPLERARVAARAGRSAEAVTAYREAFGGSTPTDDRVALEYYETLAGTQDGWTQAREGLAALVARDAADSRAALSYARVLTYREPSRREGIAKLAALAGDRRVGTESRAAWRQALLWLMAKPGDEGLFRQYAEVVGRDADLERRLSELASRPKAVGPSVIDERLKTAFAALEGGDVEAAESGFERVLAGSANNPDARAGLGVVRLRQNRFAEARRLLDGAITTQPSLRSRYAEAQRSAAFWERVRAAEAADARGDLAAAATAYASALGAVPSAGNEPSIERAYADVLLRSSKPELAERRLRGALQLRPNEPQLLSALAGLLVSQDRGDEAQRLLASVPSRDAGALRGVRVELARSRAAAAVAEQRLPEAEALLKEALAAAPESPWVRLDLARVLRRMGRASEADSLLDAMVEAAPEAADGRLAQAYAYAESQRWYETLAALEQVPVTQRSGAASRLQREAWVRYQVQRAAHAANAGDASAAVERLSAAVAAAGPRPELASALAQGWTALGDPARAVAELRRSLSAQAQPAAGDRIQYAALLLQIDQDAEFEAVSAALIRSGTMTAGQQAALEDLIVGYRVKLADRARERGDLSDAYRQLREVVARYPDQLRVKLAMARLFESAGEPEKSLALTRGLLRSAPEDASVRGAAIESALAAGDELQAERWIDDAFERGADLPDVHRAAARLAEQRGRQALALEHYRRADALEQGESARAGPPLLVLLEASGAAGEPLPQSLSELIGEQDVPVGPLLPRAPGPDAVPTTLLPPERFAGFQLERGVKLRGAAGVPPSAGAPAAAGLRGLKLARGVSGAIPASSSTGAAADPMLRLESAVSGWTQGVFQSRNRIGESGLSRLLDVEFAGDLASTQWRGGRFAVRARPVYLNAGTVAGANKLLFGTLALIVGDTPDLPQSESGTAFDVAWRLGSLGLDMGTTPLGFPAENLVGGLRWTPQFGDLSLAIDVSRRAVTDSLLSYSGTLDPLTGRDWGAVARSGARTDAAYDFSGYGVYVNGGYYTIDGRNVEDNTQYEFGGGVFLRALSNETRSLTVGLNLTTFGYERNLRHFTFGHGGYFSPQFFLAVTVPVTLTGTYGNLSYSAEAAVGLQNFREDGAPLFPGRASLQTELEDLAEFEPESNLPLGYRSQSNSGLGYRLGGAAQYRLSERLAVGGSLAVDNARDFQEFQFLAYLRWYFTGVQPVPESPQLPRIFESPLR